MGKIDLIIIGGLGVGALLLYLNKDAIAAWFGSLPGQAAAAITQPITNVYAGTYQSGYDLGVALKTQADILAQSPWATLGKPAGELATGADLKAYYATDAGQKYLLSTYGASQAQSVLIMSGIQPNASIFSTPVSKATGTVTIDNQTFTFKEPIFTNNNATSSTVAYQNQPASAALQGLVGNQTGTASMFNPSAGAYAWAQPGSPAYAEGVAKGLIK